MDDGNRKSQFLFPAKWYIADELVSGLFHVEFFHKVCGSFFDYFPAESINPGVKAHVFKHGKVVVQGELLAHVTYVLFDLLPFPVNIKTTNIQFAGGRIREPAKDLYGRSFTRSVCTKKTKDLAFFHLKTQVVIGDKRPELLHQVPDYDNIFGLRSIHLFQRISNIE